MKMQFKELNSLIYVLKTFITAVHFLSYIFVKCNRIEAICAVLLIYIYIYIYIYQLAFRQIISMLKFELLATIMTWFSSEIFG